MIKNKYFFNNKDKLPVDKFFEKELCYQALVMLAIQMLYYLMYPWPEKMADHLETKEQKDLWKNVNSHMSKRKVNKIVFVL